MADVDRTTLERAREESTGPLLLKAARLLDEQALARLRALPSAPPIRPAHTRLFPHLPFEGGIRGTEVAERLGVTKQAVSALVSDLESWGMVELVPDPSDGRARLISYTAAGRASLLHGLGVLGQIEGELADRIGVEKMGAFREGLASLVAMLEERGWRRAGCPETT